MLFHKKHVIIFCIHFRCLVTLITQCEQVFPENHLHTRKIILNFSIAGAITGGQNAVRTKNQFGSDTCCLCVYRSNRNWHCKLIY